MSDFANPQNLLDYDGLTIRQDPSLPALSEDALLLADFAHPVRKEGRIIDLGTGLAPIPLFLSLKTEAKIIGLEIIDKAAMLAEQSVKDNHLQHQITIIEGDIKGVRRLFDPSSFDNVICNPPFFPRGRYRLPEKGYAFKVARHEIAVDFVGVVRQAKYLLKQQGTLTFIQRAERSKEIGDMLPKHGFNISRVKYVHPYADRPPRFLMVEAVKDEGSIQKHVEPPLFVFDKENIHSKAYQRIMNVGRDRFEKHSPS